MKRVLVVCAHPDDEVLGCGGTMAALADRGCRVDVAFLADGIGARNPGAAANAELERRHAAAHKAAQILGVSEVVFDDLPDNRLDTVALLDIVQRIEALISRFQPDTVFSHHAGDVNIDHRRVHEAVIAACRPQGHCPVRSLLFFEVASSTEWQPPGSAPVFAPNWFVDIGATLSRKMDALAAYHEEMRDWPHPRSLGALEHLARWRGATVSVQAAEAFVLGRHCQ